MPLMIKGIPMGGRGGSISGIGSISCIGRISGITSGPPGGNGILGGSSEPAPSRMEEVSAPKSSVLGSRLHKYIKLRNNYHYLITH